jgi:hypothetical protein
LVCRNLNQFVAAGPKIAAKQQLATSVCRKRMAR